jgi:hypothetical protein
LSRELVSVRVVVPLVLPLVVDDWTEQCRCCVLGAKVVERLIAVQAVDWPAMRRRMTVGPPSRSCGAESGREPDTGARIN